jgi:Protein of unknown function (DUF664)
VTDPTIAAARDILGDSLDELRKALDGCSADDLNRHPAGEDTNGLAVLATHALGSTRSWLSLAVAAPLPERDRDAEFRVVVEDAEVFLATFDSLAAECRTLVATEATFDPAHTGTAPWSVDDPDEPVTAAWALLHALEHLREHVGHAQLTRQLLEARAGA